MAISDSLRGSPDRPLYLDRVTAAYSALPRSHRVVLFNVVNARGEYVADEFRVPMSEDCDEAALALRDRYVLARLNNLFVTFGGAALTIYAPAGDERFLRGLERSVARFDFARPTNDRTGFGLFANCMSRINRAAGLPAFTVAWRDIGEYATPPSGKAYRLFHADNLDDERALLRRGVLELADKTFVGLDVGGTNIKAAAIVDGEIAALYNYPWHPATFTRVEEIVGPILDIAGLMAAAATLYAGDFRHPLLADMRDCGPGETAAGLAGRIRRVSEALKGPVAPLDGLVCGFPDIVIGDKVVGGEVYKMRGIRQRDPVAYDADFASIMHIDRTLSRLCRPGGATVVMNDGFVTSNVIAAEKLFSGDNSQGDKCLLVHTIGTEMGTGVIAPAGADQDIPIEGYNWIIDLGCPEYSGLVPDDVRSCDNFNTAAPGTIQKIISQSGLIRLAVENFSRNDPGRLDELVADGLLAWEKRGGVEALVVSEKPRDRRSDLVRRLISLLKKGDPNVREAYRGMGSAMGALIRAMGELLAGIELDRFVSGGVIAEDECFAAFAEGLKAAYPGYGVMRLDTETAFSPLLGKLPCHDIGFMTAVGAAYVASRRLLRREAGTGRAMVRNESGD